jgi:thioredoxin-related protein
MTENFYMVKLDAEQKEPIEFGGKTYTFVASGRRGYHQLAAALLQGKLSYPTVVFLDENLKMLSPVPGYQKPDAFLKIARYFGENIYRDTSWEAYSGQSR